MVVLEMQDAQTFHLTEAGRNALQVVVVQAEGYQVLHTWQCQWQAARQYGLLLFISDKKRTVYECFTRCPSRIYSSKYSRKLI